MLGDNEQIECGALSDKMTVDPDSSPVDVGVDDEADLSERPVSELKGSYLEYSACCTPKTCAPKEDKNECIFCEKKCAGTLREIRCHMVKLSPDSKSSVAKCKPHAQWPVGTATSQSGFLKRGPMEVR